MNRKSLWPLSEWYDINLLVGCRQTSNCNILNRLPLIIVMTIGCQGRYEQELRFVDTSDLEPIEVFLGEEVSLRCTFSHPDLGSNTPLTIGWEFFPEGSTTKIDLDKASVPQAKCKYMSELLVSRLSGTVSSLE